MKMRSVFVAAAVALMAAPANAGLLYDTIHSTTNNGNTQIANPGTGNGVGGTFTRGGPIALEFTTTGTTQITQVQFELAAAFPSDGGTIMVYLVPDNGGTPWTTGTGPTLALGAPGHVATLLTSLPDSSLTTSDTLYSLGVNTTVGSGNFWLGLTDVPCTTGGTCGSATAVIEFDRTAFTSGIGMAGESDFFQAGSTVSPCPDQTTSPVICGTMGSPITYALTTDSTTAGKNVYEAAIFTPEPASLAVLGAGLAGLCLVRRRRRS